MPLLSSLLKALFGNVTALIIGAVHGYIGFRLALVALIAAAYIGCVAVFTAVVAPFWSSITSTSYGAVLGLAFPPVAGTVLASLVGLWGCILAKRLTVRILKAI